MNGQQVVLCGVCGVWYGFEYGFGCIGFGWVGVVLVGVGYFYCEIVWCLVVVFVLVFQYQFDGFVFGDV